jgi:hypothetical protein
MILTYRCYAEGSATSDYQPQRDRQNTSASVLLLSIVWSQRRPEGYAEIRTQNYVILPVTVKLSQTPDLRGLLTR